MLLGTAATPTFAQPKTPTDGGNTTRACNHGFIVSTVARLVPPGPMHGKIVSAVARGTAGGGSLKQFLAGPGGQLPVGGGQTLAQLLLPELATGGLLANCK